MTDDLIAWLTAQIDDDERTAQAATPGPWRLGDVTNYPAHMGQSATLNGPDLEQDGGADPVTGERLRVMRPQVVIPPDVDYGPCVELVDVEHMVRQDPPRALREVAAKRKTLAVHRITTYPPYPEGGRPQYSCQRCDWTPEEELHDYGFACEAVLAIASVYSDRPGYRPEWRLT